MPWRYLACRYGWAMVVYNLIRSPRWSDEEKVASLFVLGMFISGPVVASQVLGLLWLLTGRGPYRWMFRPNVAFVNPMPRWTIPEGALERVVAAGNEEYGESPIAPRFREPPR
jgi:hypothetical protein